MLWDAFPGYAVCVQGKAGQGAARFDMNCPCPHPPARLCVEAEEILSCEESYSLWNALIKQASLEEVEW